MKIVKGKEQLYKEWYDNNADSSGRACFTYAERWAEMLEKKIDEAGEAGVSTAIHENAYRLSFEADVERITGSMYGKAVRILSQFWEYGEELRKWNNKKYNHKDNHLPPERKFYGSH